MRFLNDFFHFNARERNGLAVLYLLLVLACGFHHWAGMPDELTSQEIAQLNELVKEFDVQQDSDDVQEFRPDSLFDFDPNHLDRATWQALGLADWQVDMIHKYESKGGSFKIRTDVLKMYCIDTSTYRLLEPYIQLPETYEYDRPTYPLSTPEPRIVDLNQAGEEELDLLWGIGPVLARRIIERRKDLGGFHSVEQLLEVYGVERSVLDSNEAVLIVSGGLHQLDINTLTAKQLQEHPYLDWNAAGHIVQWRVHHGPFDSVGVLRSEHLILAEIYGKIAPYLTTGE